jgi:hypothetical protein
MKIIVIAMMFGMLLNLGVASRANAATDQINPKVASLVTVTHSTKGCQVTAKPGAFLTDGTKPVPAGLSGVRVLCKGSCSGTGGEFKSCKLTVDYTNQGATCEGCPETCYVLVEHSK